ncbi:hypothetical protein JWG45_00085 [Leptospira sp. 201903070]|uniref:Lipoprotein n=1 Tax=Leptospira ainlahdjerensis TaxID=2810033 RepID=A0ABS2U581_9LEPT|nr:hypothetical protein [Leptospira ainlahdjerensis]MBM9575538.1 hypothetical protein [Leptospira ainlahdjerensis]
MKIKPTKILLILPIYLSLISNCSFVRKQIYGSEIKAVLAQDEAAYNSSQKDIEAGATKTQALSTYTKSMRKIDTSDCPMGFRNAYLRHIQAWEQVVQSMKDKETASTSRLLIGLFSLFIGQPQVALTSFLSELQAEGVDTSPIRTTWNEVELQAQKYDAVIDY